MRRTFSRIHETSESQQMRQVLFNKFQMRHANYPFFAGIPWQTFLVIYAVSDSVSEKLLRRIVWLFKLCPARASERHLSSSPSPQLLVPKWQRGGKKAYKSFRLLLQGGDSLYVEFNAGDILQDRIFKGSSHHIIWVIYDHNLNRNSQMVRNM